MRAEVQHVPRPGYDFRGRPFIDLDALAMWNEQNRHSREVYHLATKRLDGTWRL